MIRLAIAEDQALVRESLAIVLGLQDDMEVAWTAVTGNEAVRNAELDPVDVILMDLRMPERDGISAMRHIRQTLGSLDQPIFIVLTTFHHDEWLMDALRAGASACFLKEVPPDLLVQAIRHIVAGNWSPSEWDLDWRKYAPDIQFQAKVGPSPDRALTDPLSGRELDLLRKICSGATNAEIAAAFHLSEGTVKNYVSTLYAKLGVRHRAEAVKAARERGLA
jgi:two-component system, NarL family, response regulator DesR